MRQFYHCVLLIVVPLLGKAQENYVLKYGNITFAREIQSSVRVNDVLYNASFNTGTASVEAVDLISKESLWSFRTNESGRFSSIDAMDTLVCVGGYTTNSSKPTLLLLNSSGDVLWQRYFSPSGSLPCVRILSDRSILASIGGTICRISPNGDLLWGKQIQGVTSYPIQLITYEDAFYCILTKPISSENDDMGIIKFDFSGNIIWSKTYLNDGQESIYAGDTTSQGNIIIVGYHDEDDGIVNYDNLIVELDTSGIVQQSISLGNSTEEIALDVHVDDYGDIIIAGKSSLSVGGFDVGQIFKLNVNFSVDWSYLLNNSNGERIFKCDSYQGGYLFTGLYGPSSWIIKTSGEGVVGCLQSPINFQQGSPTFIVTDMEVVTVDIDFVSGNVSWTPTQTVLDTVCLESGGVVGINETKISTLLFPNPSEGLYRISLETTGTVNYAVYNVYGSKVASNTYVSNGRDTKTLDLRNFKSGVYTIILETSSGTVVRKLLKE